MDLEWWFLNLRRCKSDTSSWRLNHHLRPCYSVNEYLKHSGGINWNQELLFHRISIWSQLNDDWTMGLDNVICRWLQKYEHRSICYQWCFKDLYRPPAWSNFDSTSRLYWHCKCAIHVAVWRSISIEHPRSWHRIVFTWICGCNWRN